VVGLKTFPRQGVNCDYGGVYQVGGRKGVRISGTVYVEWLYGW
jgi:hypothetical protein